MDLVPIVVQHVADPQPAIGVLPELATFFLVGVAAVEIDDADDVLAEQHALRHQSEAVRHAGLLQHLAQVAYLFDQGQSYSRVGQDHVTLIGSQQVGVFDHSLPAVGADHILGSGLGGDMQGVQIDGVEGKFFYRHGRSLAAISRQ
ncbi:hypothetical protein D3C81_1716650 [compost metagenome]